MNIYDQLKQLWARVTGLEKSGAATDTKIAALEAAAVRIPKDYSENETATGIKWIDGKEIYSKTYTGIFDGNALDVDDLSTKNVIDMIGTLNITSPGNDIFPIQFRASDTNRFLVRVTSNILTISSASTIVSARYYLTVFYTKLATTREPDEHETKATKKKATK